jgi:hypothetical protein
MCALHFQRNSQPRFAISAQTTGSGSYGDLYEVITAWNISSQSVAYASSAGSVGQANNASAFDYYANSGGEQYRTHTTDSTFGPSGYNTPGIRSYNTSNPYSNKSWMTAGFVGTIDYNDQYRTIVQPYNVSHYTPNGNGSFNAQSVSGYDSYSGQYSHNAWQIYSSNTNGYSLSWQGWNGDLSISGTLYQNQGSDEKLKDNITTIPNALDRVKAIRGVEFDWNELAFEYTGKEGHDVGVIAQELEAVYPIAVREYDREAEDRVYSHLVVDYDKLHPLALQAIKELAAIVDELKLEVQALKSQINGSNI